MAHSSRDTLAAEIRVRLSRLSPTQVWRPVPGPDGILLHPGSGPDPAALADYASGVDFAGKSVIDLGCNLGFFSFMACRAGAGDVLGLDADPEVVAVARLLAELHGLAAARFTVRDFLRAPGPDRADLVLAIDFIGRGVVAKGRLDAVLDTAAVLARREIFFTLRPVYALDDLALDTGAFPAAQAAFVRRGRFHLAEYAAWRLGTGWTGRFTDQGRAGGSGLKAALLFTRRSGEGACVG